MFFELLEKSVIEAPSNGILREDGDVVTLSVVEDVGSEKSWADAWLGCVEGRRDRVVGG